MHRFDPPAPPPGKIVNLPIIWADQNSRTLTGVTKLAFDPRKVTKEVDLIFDIDLNMIEATS